MKRITFLSLLAIAIIFSACTDEKPDTQNPVITLHHPEDDQLFSMGDIIDFDATLEDNIALNQMKVDIHKADGHDHKSFTRQQSWEWDTIIDLRGRSVRQQFEIAIPLNIESGFYDLLVIVTDKSGNEAFEVIEIEIED
jgi:hypothetical protein